VQLEAFDSLKVVATMIGNTLQDIELSGIDHSAAANSPQSYQILDIAVPEQSDFLKSLWDVMSKLELFVQIVNRAANVCIGNMHVRDQLLTVHIAFIRQFRMANDFIAVQGTVQYILLFNNSLESCFQAVQGQLERDMMLVDLVKTMEEVYSFVEISDSFQRKVQLLENTIDKILKQTVECAIFIRECTGHGFGDRLARQTVANTGRKIVDFSQALVALKRSLDSSNIIQTVFFSTRTLEGVERLGTLNSLTVPLSDILTIVLLQHS